MGGALKRRIKLGLGTTSRREDRLAQEANLASLKREHGGAESRPQQTLGGGKYATTRIGETRDLSKYALKVRHREELVEVDEEEVIVSTSSPPLRTATAAPAATITSPTSSKLASPLYQGKIFKTKAYRGLGRLPFFAQRLDELLPNASDDLFFYVASEIAPNAWKVMRFVGSDIDNPDRWNQTTFNKTSYGTAATIATRIGNWTRHVEHEMRREGQPVNIYPEARTITAQETSPRAPAASANGHQFNPVSAIMPTPNYATLAFHGAAAIKYISSKHTPLRITFPALTQDYSQQDTFISASRQNGSWHVRQFVGAGLDKSNWNEISDVEIPGTPQVGEILRLMHTWSYVASTYSRGYNTTSVVSGAQIVRHEIF